MKPLPVTGSLRTALVSLYGAVAAIVRADWWAFQLMSSDLRRAFNDVDEVLIVVALATLECLEDAANGPDEDREPSDIAAREMLLIACGYPTSAEPVVVNSAAWRLDAIRRGDQSGAAHDLVRSKRLGTDTQLIHGSIALLAAVVTRRALRTGRSPGSLAGDLCLAAAMAEQ